jgi:hypothetical protein
MRQPNSKRGEATPPDFKRGLDTIYFLCKGPSWYGCPHEIGENEELWGLNSVYMDRPDIDRLFIMHDIRDTLLLEDHNLINQCNELGFPVVTTGTYTTLTNNVPYPVEEVIDHFRVNYVQNSVCWMLALAIYLEVKEIHMYGADYVFGVDLNEKACTEFWMGMAMGRGIHIYTPKETALLRPPEFKQTLYGYHVPRAAPDGLINIVAKRRREGDHREYTMVPKEEAG